MRGIVVGIFSALKFNLVQLIQTNLFYHTLNCQNTKSISVFHWVFFAQNLKVAVPESISADLGECIPPFCRPKL